MSAAKNCFRPKMSKVSQIVGDIISQRDTAQSNKLAGAIPMNSEKPVKKTSKAKSNAADTKKTEARTKSNISNASHANGDNINPDAADSTDPSKSAKPVEPTSNFGKTEFELVRACEEGDIDKVMEFPPNLVLFLMRIIILWSIDPQNLY